MSVPLGPFPLADKMPWTEVSQLPAAGILGATWRRRGEEAGQEGLSIDYSIDSPVPSVVITVFVPPQMSLLSQVQGSSVENKPSVFCWSVWGRGSCQAEQSAEEIGAS